MGQKILQVSGALLDMLVHGTEIHCEIERAVPDNTKLVKISTMNAQSIIELYYECPDWPEIAEQSKPPIMEPPRIKKMEIQIA
ncbi:hypothetical protein LCGC14_0758230 [marine sediment metagenome]|uniref:Uncharacterized protein n=1 Tax=marine sediment metagenome TaxID=412755 RepID=A0A0F9SM80_9ZZZZ